MFAHVMRGVCLGLLLVFILAVAVWANEEVNAWSKMGGFLQAQLAAKMNYLEKGSRRDLDLMAKNRIGVDDSHPARQRVYLHFRSKPTDSQMWLLRRMGVKLYEGAWIPPMRNHPTGFMIADIQVTRALDVAKQDFIVRMGSAEIRRFPDNDHATAGANVDDMWGQGLDGSGVLVAVLDSGIDTTHADFPTLVGGKDYHMAPDSLDDTIANTVTGHGTHVAGSVLGRGTLSAGGGENFKGSAPGADLVFLKIGGDASSSASDAAMIAAYIAAVDTYGVDIISVSYGGLDEFNDGSEEQCQTIDWAVSQGVLYFNSAGNSADDGMHYSGALTTKSSSDTIQIQVDSDIILPLMLTWYDGADTSVHVDLELNILDATYAPVACTAYVQTHSPRGTESQYFESDSVTAGTYYAVLTVNSPKEFAGQLYHLYSGEWDAWFPSGADPFYTVVGGAAADEGIAVGAWVSRTVWCNHCWSCYTWGYDEGDIAPFSSRGPRIDGAGPQLPFISAGGSMVNSCRDNDVYPFPPESLSTQWYYTIDNDYLNMDGCPGPADYYSMHGTSMACPIAAGAAALLLQHNPLLTPSQVKAILSDNAMSDSYTGGVPNNTWGHGKIDVFIDLTAPSRIGDLAITSVDWNKVALGWTAPGDDGTSGTADQYDVRYSTSPPAKADTAAWWAGATQATGEPAPQAYGNSESMEVTGLTPNTPYYFAIKALDEHYNAGDISDIVMDVTLAVTLSSFEATPVPEGILVEWVAESERHNRGYHLSRSLSEEGPFDFLVYLAGAGNSSASRSYQFVDEEVTDGVTYWYLLESEDVSGQRSSFGPIQVTAERVPLPKEFALSQNYPNPFNPITRIKYQLAGDVPVRLLIYNVRGQQVVALVDRHQSAGYYQVEWRGTDGNGRELASGVYFYRLQAGEHVFIKKMVLLK
jgi:subtilisin family serine protease